MMRADDPVGTTRAVLIWVTEAAWAPCVDAGRAFAPAGASFVLLHVSADDAPQAAHGAFAGLLGRGRPERDPGARIEADATETGQALLAAAARRLALPCALAERRGRPEREVLAEAADASLLVMARDGDRSRLGPRSLGPAGRFVVDHAPCPVLLIWPEQPPRAAGPPGAADLPARGRRGPSGRVPPGTPPHPGPRRPPPPPPGSPAPGDRSSG